MIKQVSAGSNGPNRETDRGKPLTQTQHMSIERIATGIGPTLSELWPTGFDQGLTSDHGSRSLEQSGHQTCLEGREGNPAASQAQDATFVELRGRELLVGTDGPELSGSVSQGRETGFEVDGRGRDPDPVFDGAGAHRGRAGFDQQEVGLTSCQQRSTPLLFTGPSNQGHIHAGKVPSVLFHLCFPCVKAPRQPGGDPDRDWNP